MSEEAKSRKLGGEWNRMHNGPNPSRLKVHINSGVRSDQKPGEPSPLLQFIPLQSLGELCLGKGPEQLLEP